MKSAEEKAADRVRKNAARRAKMASDPIYREKAQALTRAWQVAHKERWRAYCSAWMRAKRASDPAYYQRELAQLRERYRAKRGRND